ncbi:MAG: hypothetical protein COA94_03605 [Rickettsiales bacterium]|nr:MAG: hypothetical protein COA94_03605 [Rickettsiales bacterium]
MDRAGYEAPILPPNSPDMIHSTGFEEAVNAMTWLIEHYKADEGNESFAIYDIYGCTPLIEGSFNSRLYRD